MRCSKDVFVLFPGRGAKLGQLVEGREGLFTIKNDVVRGDTGMHGHIGKGVLDQRPESFPLRRGLLSAFRISGLTLLLM